MAGVSIKGLDGFSSKFLGIDKTKPEEYLLVKQGQKASDEAIKKYQDERTSDFIQRAASFTEDLVGFIVQQKKLRGLSDVEAVFGIALANINLRHAYGSEQGKEKLSSKQKEDLLSEFDEVCWGAQQYWDAHANEQ